MKSSSGIIKPEVKREIDPESKDRRLEHSKKTIIEMTIQDMKEKGWVK
jgi:hypothetical protein